MQQLPVGELVLAAIDRPRRSAIRRGRARRAARGDRNARRPVVREHRGARDLAGVEDVVGVERVLDRAHEAHAGGAVLELEIAGLAVADAVLAGARAAGVQRAAHDAVVELHAARDVGGVVAIDQQRDVEVAVADVAQDRAGQAVLVEVGARADDGVRQRWRRGRPRRSSARSCRGAAPAWRRRRGGARPTSAGAGPRRWPTRTRCRRARRRSARSPWPVRPPRRGCRGTRGRASGATAWSRSLWRLMASINISSSSSMRATGIAFCETDRTQSTASRRVGKAHTAADIASGVGCTRSVASQTSPSVPSEPMKRRVRSYPAEDLRARERVRTTCAVGGDHGRATGRSRASPRSAPSWCPRRRWRPCRRAWRRHRGRPGRRRPRRAAPGRAACA